MVAQLACFRPGGAFRSNQHDIHDVVARERRLLLRLLLLRGLLMLLLPLLLWLRLRRLLGCVCCFGCGRHFRRRLILPCWTWLPWTLVLHTSHDIAE